MTETHKGRCLCGAVEFEFEGKPNWVAYCHCESCRRNTSSPTTTFIGVGRDNYRFTKGETAFYESSPGVRRHFCATCGTPMAFDADHYPEEIHFYLASLLDPEKKKTFDEGNLQRQESLRFVYSERKARPLLSYADALENRLRIDWRSEDIAAPVVAPVMYAVVR